ncbi:MAG: TrkA family potassium uptake protein [Planctomycetes bacterium]|nr:TrkA family potassium uptake protein [Planctomycetota bacterium]
MKQYAVVGLGRFGSTVARELMDKGAEVIAIDRSKKRVEAVKNDVSSAIQIDTMDEESLRQCGIEKVDAAIVCMGLDTEESILATTILKKKIGINRVIARAGTRLHAEILEMVGAEEIVFPERDIGEKVAVKLVSPGLEEFVELGEDLVLAEIEVKTETLAGKSLKDLGLFAKYKISPIIIKKKVRYEKAGKVAEEEIRELPDPDYVVSEGDTLLVLGETKDVEGFVEKHVK